MKWSDGKRKPDRFWDLVIFAWAVLALSYLWR